nr:MAG TPA: hypothetical protein [Inoviridae sp.]
MSFVDWLDYDWTIYEKEPITIFGWLKSLLMRAFFRD